MLGNAGSIGAMSFQAPGGYSPNVSLNGTVGSMSTWGGTTTIYSSGNVSTHTMIRGTLHVTVGGYVRNFTGSGQINVEGEVARMIIQDGGLAAASSTVTIAGVVGTVVLNSAAVVTIASRGFVASISMSNTAAPSTVALVVYGNVSTSTLMGGSTVVSAGAAITRHVQLGGAVTLVANSMISYLTGFGTFLITGGSVGQLFVTGPTFVIVRGTVTNAFIQASINMSNTAAPSTVAYKPLL